VGLGEGLELSDAVDEEDDDPGLAVRTGSSSSREASHQPPTSRTATAPAARRTQKPVSGSGVPVPGWV
jgi:hypothetical protein